MYVGPKLRTEYCTQRVDFLSIYRTNEKIIDGLKSLILLTRLVDLLSVC